MSETPQGLLFVLGQCEPEVPTHEFNGTLRTVLYTRRQTNHFSVLEWYDGEHAPARLTVPGLTSATRYKATDDQKPEWLAMYDLSSPETVKTPAYLSLGNTASQKERELVPRLPILQRRIYSLIAQSVKPGLLANTLPGKHLLVVLWSVPKELDAEFHRWYDEEHTAEIAKGPGWLRARRYRLTEGVDLSGRGPPIEGWDYLVMHEWEKAGCTETQEFATAIQTPWATKILGGANAFSLRQFELYKNFTRP
jgi:hypothetical protein